MGGGAFKAGITKPLRPILLPVYLKAYSTETIYIRMHLFGITTLWVELIVPLFIVIYFFSVAAAICGIIFSLINPTKPGLLYTMVSH